MLRIHGLTLIAVLLIAFVPMAIAGSLGSLTVTPSNSQAGQSAIYTLSFTTSSLGNDADVGIPKDGKIVVSFPAGFNLLGVNNAAPSPGSNLTGDFNLPTVVGNVVTLVRDGTGNDVGGDINVLVDFEFVANATVVGNYQLTVETRTAADVGIDNGTSANFSITPGALHHFIFNPISSPQTAGSGFNVTITAKDVHENTVTSFSGAGSTADLTASTGAGTISPANTGAFTNGSWTGNITISKSQASVAITATSGVISNNPSNFFTVNPGALHHFTFNSISSPQTAGIGFSVTITAKDINENTVTSFTGAGSTVDLTASTGAGTISPANTGAFTNGVWTSSNVMLTKSGAAVTITATNGSVNNTSNAITINPGALDHFTFEPIATQTAGAQFTINISARDSFDNIVTSFTGTASLSNITTSISPTTTTAFTAGVWAGGVTINTSQTNDVITASSAGKQGQSAPFNVIPGSLDHFSFVPIGGPQVAGQPFQITIRAMDNLNNIVTSFTGPGSTADLSASTGPGTITPLTTTGGFTNGQWIGNVTITKSQASVMITATSGIIAGSSNLFAINPAALDHFTFNTIANQNTGAQFPITITAQDAFNNTVTSYVGFVNLTDLSLSIAPAVIGPFNAGIGTGNVSVTKSQTANVITATDAGGSGKQGFSNSFDVIPLLDRFEFTTNIPSPRIAGAPFSVTITAKDAFNNTVVSFTGTAQLSDDTNTLTPTVTGNFIAGGWTGNNLVITKSQGNVRIRAQASGKQGFSNFFTINPAALNNFSFAPIGSPQIAGKKFLVSITARDAYNNTITGFASTVNLSVPNDTTLTPDVATNFVNGVWSDSVSLTKSQFGITITATQGLVSSPSNTFDVSPGSLDRFVFGSIPSPQIAGAPFPISITAVDLYSNILTAYADSVTLSDPFNTISPTKIGGFINGAWSGNVTLTKADANTAITASVSGKSSPSNTFEIVHAALDRFSITDIGDQTAGENFSVSITALDPYLNTVLSFTETVGLQDSTGTINPTQSQTFSSGQWTGQVNITKSQLTRITANFLGAIGKSNSFFINPAALHHFSIDSVGNQMAGVPFSITIRAHDLYQNFVTSFASNVTLDDLTDSIYPREIEGFQSGLWSGPVLVIQPSPNNQITAARSGGNESGTSNSFALAQSLAILAIDASPAKVNRGQQDAVVNMVVSNIGAQTINITSASLAFTGPPPGNQNRTAQYSLQRTDNVTSIAPATSQTLTFAVDVSQTADLEVVTIDGAVSGEINSNTITDNNSDVTDQWEVQSPAALSIASVIAGVDTVSRGQTDLHVTLRVTNTGTADAQVTNIGLRFRLGGQDVTSSYFVSAPGGAIIPGGTSNNNFDIIVNVSSTAPTGLTVIDGMIFARDVNTNAVVADSGATTTDSWQVNEAPIIAFVSIVPSQSTVTLLQSNGWTVTMTVANNGGSDVRLDSTKLSLIIGSDVTSQYNISRPSVFVNRQTNVLAGNGAQDQLQFTITAKPSNQTIGLAAIQGHVHFTDLGTMEGIDRSSTIGQASVIIQSPANVSITSIVRSQPNVNRGQTQDWEVTVRLSNTGQSDVRIDTVAAATRISFSPANDFTVFYKSFSGDANLVLRGSSTADLVYTVDTSSNQLGEQVISATVAWIELNSSRRIVTTAQGQQSVIVQIPAELFIEQTQASSSDVFAGSPFQVNVTVRNSGQESVRNISVALMTNGSSNILVSPQTRAGSLNGGGAANFIFDVQANAVASFQETFTARILQGTGDNTSAPAAIAPALDSTAIVNIESNLLNSSTVIAAPSAALDGVVSTGQSFTLITEVVFAPDQIHDVQATLSLPPGYITTGSLTRQISATGDTVHWGIIAPQTGETNSSEISMQAEGENAVEETIFTTPDVISMRTIERPRLRVVSHVFQPPGARSVMIGQQFVVQAEMENDGEAAVAGSASVRLVFESSAYTTTDNAVQLFTVGSPASWTILAPSQAALASRIYCVMSRTGLPNDENGVPIVVVDDSSEVWISTIADTSLTFSNYPNPFGSPARGERTTFYYFLRQDTDVQIRIFSLLGELVWQRSYKSTDLQGEQGLHEEVKWNATNGGGEPVLNGVYIAHITTGDGQQATRKIAVLK